MDAVREASGLNVYRYRQWGTGRGGKEQACGSIESTAPGGDERVDETARRPVVPQHATKGIGDDDAGDIQVAVGSRNQPDRTVQPAAGGEDPYERACRLIVV